MRKVGITLQITSADAEKMYALGKQHGGSCGNYVRKAIRNNPLPTYWPPARLYGDKFSVPMSLKLSINDLEHVDEMARRHTGGNRTKYLRAKVYQMMYPDTNGEPPQLNVERAA